MSAAAAVEELDPGIYYDDPVRFFEDILGTSLWSKQREVVAAIGDRRRVVVPSAHDMGKTFLAAGVVWWWMTTRYPACVVTTAPTHHQVVDLLWKEINAAYRRLPSSIACRFQCDVTKIKKFDRDGNRDPLHLAFGLSTDRTDSFQGVHGENLMVVADEAAGVADEMFGILDSFGPVCELYIGNPTSGEGRFIQAAQNEELGYACVKIDAFDSPAWTGEKVETRVLRQLMPMDLERKWAILYGEDSEWYQSRVRGEFPDASADHVIVPQSWFDAAVARADEVEEPEEAHTVIIGADIADEGADRTAIACRINDALVSLETHGGKMDTFANVRVIREAAERMHESTKRTVTVRVDKSSVGKGVFDMLDAERRPGIIYEGVSFGWGARDKQNYATWRDEMHFALRDWFREGSSEPDIRIACNGQETARLKNQLSTVKWSYDARGKRKVESKKDMRDRNMPSPDELDAVCLAFMPPRRATFTKRS